MVKNTMKSIPELELLISNINEARTKKLGYMAPTAIFFISFDIVNSTTYKSMHPDTWSTSLQKILRHIISTFEISPLGGYYFWKSLGDEIVYNRTIIRISDLPTLLDEIHAKLEYLNHLIATSVLCDKDASELLSIKGTAWICDVSSSAKYTRNVFTQYDIKDHRKQMDFAGPDIDIGFRVSKYSMKNRLVISWGLAYLLLQALTPEQYEKKVHLLTFKTLDGVWHGESYPILLYHGNESISFDDSILGCDSYKERHLQTYLKEKHLQTLIENEPYFCYTQKIVLELYKHPHQFSKIENILKIIENYNGASFVELTNYTKQEVTT